jgi:HlyD family secretion protein
VWVAVNEADIGSIHAGQPVRFRVDAYPGLTFTGEVGKIRLNASMTQNVVTYVVEVMTDNSSGRLLPYLSANVQFELNRRSSVLHVPSAALRWTPQPEWVGPTFRQQGPSSPSTPPPQGASEKSGGPGAGQQARGGRSQGTLWVPDGRFVRPVHVQVGLSGATDTEVEGQDLHEGTEVVIGIQTQNAGSTDTLNPFAPRMRGGGTRGSGAVHVQDVGICDVYR